MNRFRDWDAYTLQTRMNPAEKSLRYAGGAPDQHEIGFYRNSLIRFFGAEMHGKCVLILGMTPELRRMVLNLGAAVYCVDKNPESIRLYGVLVDGILKRKETIIQGNWLDMDESLTICFDAVLGDGVFGNLLSIENHYRLLDVLQKITAVKSLFLFRKIVVPRNMDVAEFRAHQLIDKYRRGSISMEDFGFSMRIFGNFSRSYDANTYLLNNRSVFNTYAAWYNKNMMTADEYNSVMHYFYDGFNMIIPQDMWEKMLVESGFCFESSDLRERLWYRYYPVYSCSFA